MWNAAPAHGVLHPLRADKLRDYAVCLRDLPPAPPDMLCRNLLIFYQELSDEASERVTGSHLLVLHPQLIKRAWPELISIKKVCALTDQATSTARVFRVLM